MGDMLMKKAAPVLAVIVPAFNEEEVIGETIDRLAEVLAGMESEGLISKKSYLFIVDDGSSDGTWEIVRQKAALIKRVQGIKLSKNRGHQNAVVAGLESCMADAYITIDADLQDDEQAMPDMIAEFGKGAQVVYGVRRSRQSDTWFKRWTALGFYRLMGAAKTGTLYNHADYRLLSRKVVTALADYGEVNLFLRAIIPSVGFKSATVMYDRKPRLAGVSKFGVRKMLSFAWEGITSFSTVPLRLVSLTGLMIFVLTVLGAIWSLVQKMKGNVVPGWTSTVLPIFFLSGVQLLCTGILGEYIGKIYQEVKGRPRYILEERIGQGTGMPYE